MKPLALAEVARMARGVLIRGADDRRIHRVGIDSRSVQPGDLFVAIVGEKFDGHDFLTQASGAGAIAALVQKGRALPESDLALIEVEDTLVGLQQLAGAYRRSLSVKVLGVTGSSGKTSTKEFAAAVLRKKFQTRKTEGNLNNHLGVPLTLLSIQPEDEWAVVEMGMNHPGEIAALCEIAKPDHGMISSIGWSHIEFFESQQGIVDEKVSLVRSLPAGGLAFLNGDDAKLREVGPSLASEAIFSGAQDGFYCYVHDPRWMGDRMVFAARVGSETEPMELAVPGWHMVQNAGLAIALGAKVGLSLGEIREGLATAKLPKNRMALVRHRQGWLLDDAYNASPDSMAAAFRTLQLLSGGSQRIALLGAMGELGVWAERLHRWVGEQAAAIGMTHVFAVGKESQWLIEGARQAGLSEVAAQWFSSKEELVTGYQKIARADDCIVVKGSRSQQMETVVEALKQGI
jgi:UDP-N-acetylmuramoyl-tripeptide--D-alanyl-D-alanine ligase